MKTQFEYDFIYHPIGQGLFYSGNIGETSIVYDCGSEIYKKIRRVNK